MKTMRMLGIVALVGITMTGCAVKTGNEHIGQMNASSVDQMITRGQTTKEEIKQKLGDPDKIDFGSDGLERWEYIFFRKDAKVVNYIPVANWFVAGSNDTKKSLLILWNGEGKVKNFAMTESKGETKGGLFQ